MGMIAGKSTSEVGLSIHLECSKCSIESTAHLSTTVASPCQTLRELLAASGRSEITGKCRLIGPAHQLEVKRMRSSRRVCTLVHLHCSYSSNGGGLMDKHPSLDREVPGSIPGGVRLFYNDVIGVLAVGITGTFFHHLSRPARVVGTDTIGALRP